MGCYEAPEIGSRYLQQMEKEAAHSQDSCRTSYITDPIIEKKDRYDVRVYCCKKILFHPQRVGMY